MNKNTSPSNFGLLLKASISKFTEKYLLMILMQRNILNFDIFSRNRLWYHLNDHLYVPSSDSVGKVTKTNLVRQKPSGAELYSEKGLRHYDMKKNRTIKVANLNTYF